jgi:serralysin
MGGDILDGGTNVGGQGDMVAYNSLNVAVSIDLANGFAYGQGQDVLTGFESARGSNKGDAIGGDAFANRLEGLDGNDQIMARGGGDAVVAGNGNDILRGLSGNDQLNGGLGADNIAGGLNVDTIFFNSIADSGTTATPRDTIIGFVQGGANADVFHVSNIDANTGVAGDQDFTFIGAAAFSAAGQIRATSSGGVTVVEMNVTGASGAESTFAINGAFVLAVTDFTL